MRNPPLCHNCHTTKNNNKHITRNLNAEWQNIDIVVVIHKSEIFSLKIKLYSTVESLAAISALSFRYHLLGSQGKVVEVHNKNCGPC